MELWYPSAVRLPIRGASGGTYVGYPYRGVLHSTESTNYKPTKDNYFGHTNPPHFTIHRDRVYQHFALNVSARALRNLPGGVETNRGNAIQIELVAQAAKINSMPKDTRKAAKDLIAWISKQCNIDKNFPLECGGPEAYGPNGPYRMNPDKWVSFNAWCSHQHVPENFHWDIGKPDIKFLDDLGLREENLDPPHTAESDGLMDFLRSLFSIFGGSK